VSEGARPERRILCLPGPVRPYDRSGHHDYLAGCRLLADLLNRNQGVRAEVLAEDWRADEDSLEGAASLVFYDKGGGKQSFLDSPASVERLRTLARAGVGVVLVHQAVGFPTELAEVGCELVGGVYVPGFSKRGHWPSHHENFPEHAITRGVEPWASDDGWLHRIRFVEGLAGVEPLVRAGRREPGHDDGNIDDVVAWAYTRPEGGRAFCFTGIDAHSAWNAAGLRRLMVNGVLWSAAAPVPDGGAPIDLDATSLRDYLTPRRSPAMRPLYLARKAIRMTLNRARSW
jgi:hypothetical protein